MGKLWEVLIIVQDLISERVVEQIIDVPLPQMLHVFRDFEKKFGVLCKLSMCHFHNLWRRFMKLSQVWPKKDVLRLFVKRGSSYRCFVFFCFEASRSFVVRVTSCFQSWLVQGLCTGRLGFRGSLWLQCRLHCTRPNLQCGTTACGSLTKAVRNRKCRQEFVAEVLHKIGTCRTVIENNDDLCLEFLFSPTSLSANISVRCGSQQEI